MTSEQLVLRKTGKKRCRHKKMMKWREGGGKEKMEKYKRELRLMYVGR